MSSLSDVEREDVERDLVEQRAELKRWQGRPIVAGCEGLRQEHLSRLEAGVERLERLLCARCEGSGFDGQGEPCAHLQEPDSDLAYDWDRDTRALDESGA